VSLPDAGPPDAAPDAGGGTDAGAVLDAAGSPDAPAKPDASATNGTGGSGMTGGDASTIPAIATPSGCCELSATPSPGTHALFAALFALVLLSRGRRSRRG